MTHGRQTPADLAAIAATREAGEEHRRAVAELVGLMDRYERRLFAFLVVMLGDRESAGDCLQDTLLRAYENLVRGRPVNVQWLYKVARHRAIDELRHRQRVRVEADPIPAATADEPPAFESADAVREALRQLSPEDREVLHLSEVDGFTSVEIGQMLGIRPGTVRMRLLRAHVRFRRAYGDEP